MRKGFTFIESDFCLDPEELPPAGHLKECRSDALASLSYLSYPSFYFYLFILFVCIGLACVDFFHFLNSITFFSFFFYRHLFPGKGHLRYKIHKTTFGFIQKKSS